MLLAAPDKEGDIAQCGGWRMPWLPPNSMLVAGGTMHARECQGMLVGSGDLLRQIVATKGTRKEEEEL